MKDSKILFMIPGLGGGGTEVALLNLLAHLARTYNNFNIDILVLLKGGQLDERIEEEIYDQYHFTYLTGNRFLLKLLNIAIKYKATAKIISRILITKHYDIGICFEESRWSSMVAYSGNINKKVTWFHSVITTNPGFHKINTNKKALQRYKKKQMKFNKRVFVSEASKVAFEQLTGIFNNNTIVYNLIDYPFIKKQAMNSTGNGDNLYTCEGLKIVMVGNLLDVKDYPFALKVFISMKQKDIKFCVNILGGGKNYMQLTKEIEKYDLQNHVKLLGYIHNPYPYIYQSDLYFSSSISEARPTACIEAMCLGKPYVIPNIAAYTELDKTYNAGIVYEKTSVESATDAFLKITSGEIKCEEITKKLADINWEGIGSNYIDVINKCLHP